MAHVRQLASEVRPPGSPGHERSRRYLVAQLEALGLEVEVQDESVAVERGVGSVFVGRVMNVVGRMAGRERSAGVEGRSGQDYGAVALLAHYDSRPQTWGAADDAAGVATILETVRVLSSGPTLARDVIVIATDGEELGLLGARAFVDRHRWLNDIEVLINVEARGNRGPSIMFETSVGNLGLIDAYRAAVPYPFANSLSYEVYRRMPNDSDFSIFRDASVAGLNLAFIGNHPAYHTRLDSVEALSQRSLQHHGANVAALTRHLASEDRLSNGRGDAVYFSLPGWRFVMYPTSTARNLAVALLMLAATGLWRTRRDGIWTIRGLARGLLLAAAATGTGLAVAFVGQQLLQLVAPGLFDGPHGSPYKTFWLAGSIALVVFLLVSILARRLASKSRRLEILAGVLIAWTVGGLGLSLGLVGASYLLTWPAFTSWICWWIVARAGGERQPRVVQLVTAVGALPGTVLFAPTLVLFLEALGFSGVGVPAALLGLLLTLYSPQIAVVGEDRLARRALAAAALGTCLLAVWLSGPSPLRPHVDSIFYVADGSESYWYSLDSEPDQWTKTLLGADPERLQAPQSLFLGGRSVLRGTAPAIDTERSGLEVVASRSGDGRNLDLEMASGVGGQLISLGASSAATIRAVTVAGKRFEVGELSAEVRVTLIGGGREPWRIQFELAEDQPLELEILEQRYGLPEMPVTRLPRPPHLIPSSSWRTDSTFIVRRMRL